MNPAASQPPPPLAEGGGGGGRGALGAWGVGGLHQRGLLIGHSPPTLSPPPPAPSGGCRGGAHPPPPPPRAAAGGLRLQRLPDESGRWRPAGVYSSVGRARAPTLLPPHPASSRASRARPRVPSGHGTHTCPDASWGGGEGGGGGTSDGASQCKPTPARGRGDGPRGRRWNSCQWGAPPVFMPFCMQGGGAGGGGATLAGPAGQGRDETQGSCHQTQRGGKATAVTRLR